MILQSQLTAVGNLGYKPNIHHRHRQHLQHGLKTANPEYKEYLARLNQWNQKILTPRVCRFQGRFSDFAKQLLLTKYLSPYCQVISSSLIRLTYLLGFCSSSLNQIKYYFNNTGINRANLSNKYYIH